MSKKVDVKNNIFYKKREHGIMKRSELKEAEYNPRFITDQNYANLKKSLKRFGMAQDIVYNKRTGTLVSGHMRVAVMDDHFKDADYAMPVVIVDLDEKDEIALNVIMNNASIQGQFDPDKLAELKMNFPDISFEKDLLFSQAEIEYHFAQTDLLDLTDAFLETPEKKEIEAEIQEIEKVNEEVKEMDKIQNRVTEEQLRNINTKWSDKKKKLDDAGMSRLPEKNDYMVTIVFKNNYEKADFMKKISYPNTEKFIFAPKMKPYIKEKYHWKEETL